MGENPCPDPTPSDPAQCNWYLNCLNTKFDCGSEGYPIDYGYKFCSKYDENYDDFSDQGKKWIDSVKLCLQNALLPVLNDPSSYDCDSLKSYAFDTHSKCYLGNDGEFDSICDLPIQDWGAVVSTVWQGLLSIDGIAQLWETGKECILSWGFRKYILEFKSDWNDFIDFLDEFDVSMGQFGEIITNKLSNYLQDSGDRSKIIQIKGGNFYEGGVIFELFMFLNDTSLDYRIKQEISETMNEPNFYRIILNSSQTDIVIDDSETATFTLSLSDVRANVTDPDQKSNNYANMEAILIPLGIGLVSIFFVAMGYCNQKRKG